MSTGMTGRAIAYTGDKVEFTDGSNGRSVDNFHGAPDAAGCFPSANGGFYYASNSERSSSSGGGVAVIEFDSKGEVIDYFRTLSGTTRNCGGGKTPWGTWVTCEEDGNDGQVWQTDPSGNIASRQTAVVDRGGNYESFAYDDRYSTPRFFTTHDSGSGPLVRFTPDSDGLACYNQPEARDKWCTLDSGSHDFLKLNSGGFSGTFSWTTRGNANPDRYPNAEGIDVVDGILFFVSKKDETLFELDLDAGTFVRTSTRSGAFNLEPDQLKAINGGVDNMIYFCEDGGNASDLHGRNTTNGRYYTIVTGDGYSTETSGLAFSPDGRYMFMSFQFRPGVIWQFWREDGFPFGSEVVDIKYHSNSRRRNLLKVENQQIRSALRGLSHDVIAF